MAKTQSATAEVASAETTSAAPAAPATSPKEAFVLAQSETMPVKDLIAKAKDAGLEISESYAYKIRRTAAKSKGKPTVKGKPGRKPGSKNAPKTAAPAKAPKATKAPKAGKAAKASKSSPKASKSASGGKMTVKEFVLSLPLDMPASEVVSRGKDAGLAMRNGYVHEIRSSARRNQGKPATGARRGRPPKSATAAASAPAAPKAAAHKAPTHHASPAAAGPGASADEVAFRRLIVALGPARATELVSDVRQRLEDLVAGL